MIGLLVFILLAIVIIVIVFVSKDNERMEQTKKNINDKFNNLVDFETTKKIEHGEFIFAIDEKHQKVAFIDNLRVKIIPFEQIYKVEYIENATTVASKSSIRTVGGTLVGGALAGGAGAIVGGLSGDTTMKNKITLMQVKIGLRNINDPTLTIKILENSEGFDPSKGIWGVLYQKGIEYVNNIVESVSVIIDKVDRSNSIQLSESDNHSIADELSKLAQLKETGVLTEQEFEEQKQKLLNK